VAITTDGRWLLADAARVAIESGADALPVAFAVDGEAAVGIGELVADPSHHLPVTARATFDVDVVLPLLHGPYGEDGTVQGLFELADLPYVGSGVLGSAVAMDKIMMKRAFAAAQLPTPRHLSFRDGHDLDAFISDVERDLGYPCFVKPANGGSSLGVSKAKTREDLLDAVALAARFDRKVVIEEAVVGREVECAVLGNRDPQPSPLGEIRPSTEFYDYAAKYLDDSAALVVPAEVDAASAARVQEYAVRAFRALDCAGLARVDFFVEPDGGVKCIEVNTLPGFTPISMYPRLWQHAGISYPALITRLVELALERHEEARAYA